MGPMHFFGGDMSIVPIVVILIFAALFIIRAWSGRGGLGKLGRGHRSMKRGRLRGRRGMTSDETFSSDEEKPLSTASADQGKSRAQPAEMTESQSAMQVQMDKARAYQKQIDSLIKSTSDRRERDRLQELAAQVNEWLKAIEALASRIDSFRQNNLIQQDLNAVPRAIETLEGQLAEESNEATRTELERALASRKNQLAALQDLQQTINRAEIKIENTLSTLGTIYSQVLTAQSTDQIADYNHLAAEADEETRTLQDHLEALKEVKLERKDL